MSVLGRYKKSGGFIQLLNLIETCGLKKRNNLLRIIGEESAVWAETLQSKMITIEKVFEWPDELLIEIFAVTQDVTLALSLQVVEDKRRNELLSLVDHVVRRRIEERMERENTKNEVASGVAKLLVTTRQMMQEGQLKIDKYLPEHVVPRGIEEELNQKSRGELSEAGASLKLLSLAKESIKKEKGQREQDNANIKVIQSSFEQLKARIIQLEKENGNLQKDVSIMRAKLDKIKRIA